MATEEASRPSSLPPYPEMIVAAIAALSEKGGSGEVAISKFIESAYPGMLPESHASLLAEHLARMSDDGDLVCADNGYTRPGSEATPKRGRGRPPKPKGDSTAPSTLSAGSPKRGRGRPPKPKGPIAAAVAEASSGLPRGRGRPPKQKVAAAHVVAEGGVVKSGGVVKRGRGRPPKVKPAVLAADVA